MTSADRTLIAPTPEQLAEAVRRVAEAANVGATVPLEGDLAGRVAAALEAASEGDAVWGPPRPADSSHDFCAVLRAVWVSDYRGRRHVRLQSLREYLDGATPPGAMFPHRGRPPAELVYARHAYRYRATADGEAVVLVGCDCGALGEPAEVAWMGDRCGPCHDRTQEGQPLPEPLGRHERATPGRPLAVLPDGEQVLLLRATAPHPPTGGSPYEIVLWDHGEEPWSRPMAQSSLGVNFSPDGSRLGLLTPEGDGVRLLVLTWPGGGTVATLDLPGQARCFTLAPGGATAYVGDTGGLTAVDLGGATPTARPFPLPARTDEYDPLDLACSADGRWLAVFWEHGELVLYDRATGTPVAAVGIPDSPGRGVVAFTPGGDLLVCDEAGGVWFVAVPGLRVLGRFEAEPLTVNGLDVCGPWLVRLPLATEPYRCWPWQVLHEYARRQTGGPA